MASYRDLLKKAKSEIREIEPAEAETRLGEVLPAVAARL